MHNDLILKRYYREQRTVNACVSLAIALFSVLILLNQETWASAYLFAIVMVCLWVYYWNTGRRIRNGTFARGTSCISQLERIDLDRWLEHNGAAKVSSMHLPD